MKKLTYSLCTAVLVCGGIAGAQDIQKLIKKVDELSPNYSLYQKENIRAKGLIVGNILVKKVPLKTDRIIVKVAPNADISYILNAVSKKDNVKIEKIKEFTLRKPGVSINASPRMVIIKINNPDNIEKVIEHIKMLPGIINAEKDEIITAQMLPNDPYYKDLWGMEKINAQQAWNGSIGSRDIVVGIIDTGVDYLHQDLKRNIWVNTAELKGEPGKDDDGDGYVDDIYGIDTYNNDSDPMDDNGHGTHVAGTIGAVGNNGIGVVGINWRTKIVACKFLNANGYGYTSGAIECVNYINTLKDRGVNIVAVNNSWGGGSFSQDLYDAFKTAGDEGIIHVCAAGNSSNDNDSNPSYPASYDLDNIIAVAATNQEDELAWFSNYGATSVDLAAPGVDILSTIPSVEKCARQKNIYGTGFEKETALKGWHLLTIDLNYPFEDIPRLHWQKAGGGYESDWCLDDSPGKNYPDNKIQSAVSHNFDLSDYNKTTGNKCIGLQYQIKGQNEENWDRFYVFISPDGGNNWVYYMDTDKDYNAWTTEGKYIIENDLLTDKFKIALVRANDSIINEAGYKIDNLVIYEGKKYREARYDTFSGTSMATPYVTGAVALAASIYPDENITQRRNRILNGVDILESLDGKVATSGRLNLFKVLNNGDKMLEGSGDTFKVNQKWKTFSFDSDSNFDKTPVVIASPVSFNGGQGCVVRLKDINENNFTMKMQEWNYLDGKHVYEDISVVALQPGRYLMADGNVMEVGTFSLSGTGQFKYVGFQHPFDEVPKLFLTIQTYNGADTVTVRARSVTKSGFEAALFEQESLMNSGHVKEKVGYLAIYAPDGNGTIRDDEGNNGVNYQVTQVEVNSKWTDVSHGFKLLLQEEQSSDNETGHMKENIDVLYFIDPETNETVLAPFAQDVSSKGMEPFAIRYKK